MPFLDEAWASPGVGTAAGVNLDGSGPTGLDAIVLGWRFGWQFGWRRLVNPVRLAWAWKQNRKATAAPLKAAVPAVIP